MSLMLIDTHAHLAHGRLIQHLPDVLARARAAGVEKIIVAVGDVHEAATALNLAREHDMLASQAGIHPHDAKEVHANYLADLEHLLGHDECVALGEIGLDYHYDFSPREVQRRVFAEQLDLAAKLGCPVVIHTREAFEDTMDILEASSVCGEKVIFHSFTGDAAQAKIVLDFGAAVSFSGIATFKNADDVRAAARLVPSEKMLVETDCPYLSPEPVRKMKTNEPANVVHVARRLAEIRGEDFEIFAAQTTQNARRIFGV